LSVIAAVAILNRIWFWWNCA